MKGNIWSAVVSSRLETKFSLFFRCIERARLCVNKIKNLSLVSHQRRRRIPFFFFSCFFSSHQVLRDGVQPATTSRERDMIFYPSFLPFLSKSSSYSPHEESLSGRNADTQIKILQDNAKRFSLSSHRRSICDRKKTLIDSRFLSAFVKHSLPSPPLSNGF